MTAATNPVVNNLFLKEVVAFVEIAVFGEFVFETFFRRRIYSVRLSRQWRLLASGCSVSCTFLSFNSLYEKEDSPACWGEIPQNGFRNRDIDPETFVL